MYEPPTPDVVYFDFVDGSGMTSSGIYVQHHRWIPKVCGEVTAAHPDCPYRVGDLIYFREDTPDIIKTRLGKYNTIGVEHIYMYVREDDPNEQGAAPTSAKE